MYILFYLSLQTYIYLYRQAELPGFTQISLGRGIDFHGYHRLTLFKS